MGELYLGWGKQISSNIAFMVHKRSVFDSQFQWKRRISNRTTRCLEKCQKVSKFGEPIKTVWHNGVGKHLVLNQIQHFFNPPL